MTDLTTLYGLSTNGHAIQGAMTEIAAIGIVAAFAADLCQRLLQVITGLPPANWEPHRPVFAWFSRGMFVHRPLRRQLGSAARPSSAGHSTTRSESPMPLSISRS